MFYERKLFIAPTNIKKTDDFFYPYYNDWRMNGYLNIFSFCSTIYFVIKEKK